MARRDSNLAKNACPFLRQVEVFAGFLEYTDHEIGRLIEAVRETGQLDNTLVIFVAGDNGSSAEGERRGTLNEYTYFNGVQPTVEALLEHLEDWGGPMTLPHMAAGWTRVFGTPYEYVKQVASDYGGTKVGMAIRWPQGGVRGDGEPRSQFHYVIDVAPTILEAVGLPEPKMVNGTPQRPMDGVSMIYTFEDARAEERRKTQYLENFGNRAIYHQGLARTINISLSAAKNSLGLRSKVREKTAKKGRRQRNTGSWHAKMVS